MKEFKTMKVGADMFMVFIKNFWKKSGGCIRLIIVIMAVLMLVSFVFKMDLDSTV